MQLVDFPRTVTSPCKLQSTDFEEGEILNEKIDIVEIPHELESAVGLFLVNYTVSKLDKKIKDPIAHALFSTYLDVIDLNENKK